ncbi:MAG: hypothetical protein U0R70_11510 [Solirubrobacteraceae bacterium]
MPPVTVTAPRSELGRVVARALADGPAEPGSGDVLVSLDSQPPNTLLHDGHAWKDHGPARILADARAALAQDSEFVVHASYAFLRAVDEGAQPGDRLVPIVDAAREAEELVLGGPRPACVVRLGYLYGPESKDLKAYRTAFRLGRPYWAGPKDRLQHHLHTADAARALLLAARARPEGALLYATDDRPASFGEFMDHFARRIGNPLPLHLPGISRPLAHAVIAEEHMQMVQLGVHGVAAPRPDGFTPDYADCRAGVDEIVAGWKG